MFCGKVYFKNTDDHEQSNLFDDWRIKNENR